MSCYGCAKKYGIFNKEMGCPNCGFSYCKSCLQFKAVVPKLGKSEQSVCRSCQLALSDVHAKSSIPDHPAAFLQRLASLENPAKPPITVYRHDQRMQQLKRGLTQSDAEIAERLERLREGRKVSREEPVPTEDEIAKRLALLKGEDPNAQRSKQNVFVPETRSAQQQADDIIEQFQAEQTLAARFPSPAADIARRLAHLRGEDPEKVLPQSLGEQSSSNSKTISEAINETTAGFGGMSMNEANTLLAQLRQGESSLHEKNSMEKEVEKCLKDIRASLMKKEHKHVVSKEASDEDGDEDETQDVVKMVLAEAALEEKLALTDGSDEDATAEQDELPWCVICNGDAKRRCFGCDGDLFCASCFKEGHKDEDMNEHRNELFQPERRSK